MATDSNSFQPGDRVALNWVNRPGMDKEEWWLATVNNVSAHGYEIVWDAQGVLPEDRGSLVSREWMDRIAEKIPQRTPKSDKAYSTEELCVKFLKAAKPARPRPMKNASPRKSASRKPPAKAAAIPAAPDRADAARDDLSEINAYVEASDIGARAGIVGNLHFGPEGSASSRRFKSSAEAQAAIGKATDEFRAKRWTMKKLGRDLRFTKGNSVAVLIITDRAVTLFHPGPGSKEFAKFAQAHFIRHLRA
jgi:hypothetical protein